MSETQTPEVQETTPTKVTKSSKGKPRRKTRASEKRQPSLTFPPVPLSEVLVLANAIQKHASGLKMRRLTLFEKIERSPDSGPSRTLIANSARYGVTKGGPSAEFIELTENGAIATNPDSSEGARLQALFQMGIVGIPPFKHLYDIYKSNRLPSLEVMRDALADANVAETSRKACAELFLENAKFLGLLRTIAGAERLLPIEQVVEEKGDNISSSPTQASTETPLSKSDASPGGASRKEWEKICFVISPIGGEETEDRKHADMVLESLIIRALEGEGYVVVRADKITDPGMISSQVIEHILNSGLVIADLSFHNPNVFYELALRHVVGKPTVHIIRKHDRIPFDVKDFRTIVIDTDDKYQLVASLDTYKAQIANSARTAMASGSENINPITAFASNLQITLGQAKTS